VARPGLAKLASGWTDAKNNHMGRANECCAPIRFGNMNKKSVTGLVVAFFIAGFFLGTALIATCYPNVQVTYTDGTTQECSLFCIWDGGWLCRGPGQKKAVPTDPGKEAVPAEPGKKAVPKEPGKGQEENGRPNKRDTEKPPRSH
jgi:hypothetical protein